MHMRDGNQIKKGDNNMALSDETRKKIEEQLRLQRAVDAIQADPTPKVDYSQYINVHKDPDNEIARAMNAQAINGASVDPTRSNSTLAEEMVEQGVTSAIKATIVNDQEIQQDIMDHSNKFIKTKLFQKKVESEAEFNKSFSKANKDVCKNYGYDYETTEPWKVRFMKAGSAFWFVIYFIFASITICPINIFFKGISSFIKSSWLVLVLAILSYLLIVVGIPLIMKYFGIL